MVGGLAEFLEFPINASNMVDSFSDAPTEKSFSMLASLETSQIFGSKVVVFQFEDKYGSLQEVGITWSNCFDVETTDVV